MSHAVSALRAARLAIATKPFSARGGFKQERCEGCRLAPVALPVRLAHARAHACRGVPADGRHRTAQADQHRLADRGPGGRHLRLRLVAHPNPIRRSSRCCATRPGSPTSSSRASTPRRNAWCTPSRRCATGPGGKSRRPLFVLLDGTWSEARKMFSRSPYLNALAGAQPGARRGLAIPAASIPVRRPPLHQRGGCALPAPRRGRGRRHGPGRVPGRLHAPLPAGEEPVARRLGRRSPSTLP